MEAIARAGPGLHGPLHHRDIEDRLAQRGVSTPRARLALKLSWERGDIAYLNASDAWNREVRTFALTKQAYPEADLGLDRQHATAFLVEAYFETRPRYLGGLPARRAFNRIGEVLPTVLHDGQVIGTWAWDEAGRRVTASLVRGRTTPEIRTTAKADADRLTRVLRQGWTSGRPARTTMIPGQMTLLPEQIQA
ncbi:hypothetical protein ACFRAR_16295 [Kitasatospora sp. NPDC056651]|uniref:hypothetical protein n=1 Tax=Kitasatospora sp. NPDC056651 TaxID=3345892 RepID=UPI0036AAEE90